MNYIITVLVCLLALNYFVSNADLLDCERKLLPTLSDTGIKASSSENAGDKITDFLKKWGCEIKKGAVTLSEGMKEGAKRLKDKAIDLGAKIEHKYKNIRGEKDSLESIDDKIISVHVDTINSDIFKSNEPKCENGYELNSLGLCTKLK